VHLDADLYESTLAAFQLFYRRLSPGGIMLCHDYPSASGVVKALEESFRDKPDAVVELTGYQAMIVKLESGPINRVIGDLVGRRLLRCYTESTRDCSRPKP